jgi:hypothetical protein
MENTTDTLSCESENQSPLLQNPTPLYSKCLSCPDFVTACRGVDITSLGGPAEKRAYHKAIRKAFGFLVKDIYAIVKDILGKTTVDEYFGPGTGDYKWPTVTTIHNALLYLVAQKKGVPLCEHSCSSYSSEVRQQLATADLKLAGAELKSAQHESEVSELQKKIADNKGKHIAHIGQLEAAHAKSDENYAKDIEWLKNEVHLWRRFAFILLIIGTILLSALVFFVAWDVAHPATGLIRY